ncbi:hypothetical protein GWK47_007429 [Chionoecetes opilio]|uniref:Uncharacterized protein n=1 Tax=Chionoecetes opilio TaxID=41210 RepID=A0A8J4Y8Y5_CHIOP|nr:hypothetical protein GWK47_007429 [Chionoecetes opilio]
MVLVEMAGAEDTIYLCNFRVSVDGDWLCLKELAEGGSSTLGAKVDSSASSSPGSPPPSGAYTHHHHRHLPHGSSSLHTLTLSEPMMLNAAESAAAWEGCAEGSSPPHHPSAGAVGRALGLLPGLPPGLFAPYVPLSCGPSARFLLYVAPTPLVDSAGPGCCCCSLVTLCWPSQSWPALPCIQRVWHRL